jgi:very-short-patch-repair endonuclease
MSKFPLPEGEREGPAPAWAWEGEGGLREAPPSPHGLRHRTPPRSTTRAREMRATATEAERKLWSILRGSQINGFKFRRQVPVGRYIADFACPARKLIIEVDGGQHTVEADADRTAFLEAEGYRVLRFWNNEVLRNIDGTWRVIADALSPQTTPTRAAASAASLASPLQGEEERIRGRGC